MNLSFKGILIPIGVALSCIYGMVSLATSAQAREDLQLCTVTKVSQAHMVRSRYWFSVETAECGTLKVAHSTFVVRPQTVQETVSVIEGGGRFWLTIAEAGNIVNATPGRA